MRAHLPAWARNAALALSLALNAFLLLSARHGAERARPPAQGRTASKEPALPAPGAAGPRASDDACHVELDRCRADSWGLALKVITSQPHSDGGGAGRAVDRSGAPPARQQEALCEIARSHLHDHWQDRKAALTRSLAAALADPGEQAEEARKTVGRMAQALELTPREADDLAAEYGRIRTDRVARMREALGHEPIDYAAVLREAKGLYAGEDALIARMEGEDAVQRWRAATLKERTAVLAILATFAGETWDEPIQW